MSDCLNENLIKLTRSSFKAMRSRCNNPKNPSFEGYGARGISVCERWAAFACFVEDMGLRPSGGHSIDRIAKKCDSKK